MASQTTVSINRTRADWFILVGLNSGVPIAMILKYYTGGTSRTVAIMSAAVVLFIGNLAVLLAFQKRCKREGKRLPVALLMGAAALGAVSLLITILGVSFVTRHNELADLASSSVPLESIEPERKRWVVELIRRTAANSQWENNVMQEAGKHPITPSAYSPDSFANQQVIRSTMAQLRKYVDLDFQYFDRQQSAKGDFRQKMAATDPNYLKSWEAKRHDEEAAAQAANQLEHEWLAGVEALYDYAAQHTRDIAVKDGHIAIANAAIRQAFKDQFERSKALHGKLDSAVQEQLAHQQQAKNELDNE